MLSRWLLEEYIKEKLEIALSFSRRIRLKDFKLMFTVPADEKHIIRVAKRNGLKITKGVFGVVIQKSGSL